MIDKIIQTIIIAGVYAFCAVLYVLPREWQTKVIYATIASLNRKVA